MIAGLNASSTFPRLYVQILKGGLFTCPEFFLPGRGSRIISASREPAVHSFPKATQPALLKHSFPLFTSQKELQGGKKRLANVQLLACSSLVPIVCQLLLVGQAELLCPSRFLSLPSPNSYWLSVQESLCILQAGFAFSVTSDFFPCNEAPGF